MNRYWLAVVCVLVASLVSTAQEKPPKRAAGDAVMVYVDLSQIEVNVRKLREMGVDWKALSEHEKAAGNPAWLRKTAELMVENDLARMIASPRLTTVAGREAVFHVSTTRAVLLPRQVDGKIVTTVTLETYDPPTNEVKAVDPAALGGVRSSLSTVVTCKPGQTLLLGKTESTGKNSKGEVTDETATLTFLMTDTKMPELGEAKKVLAPVDAEFVEIGSSGRSVAKPKEAAAPRRR